jgi:hypothetical protein
MGLMQHPKTYRPAQQEQEPGGDRAYEGAHQRNANSTMTGSTLPRLRDAVAMMWT